MAMNGTDIYNNFTSGSSAALQAASDGVKQLADGYLQEAQAIKNLQDRMNSAWTGSSGDAASAGANPLGQAFKDSAGPLDITNASMQVQSDVFENSKSAVVPVPPAPEKPSGWSVGLKAAIPIVGPSMAASDISSYQQGVAKTDAANENNVRVMDQYGSMTGSTRDKIPMDYKVLPIDNASVGLKAASPGKVDTRTSQYSDRTRASSSTGVQSLGSTTGTGPVSAPPTLNSPSAVTSSGPSTGGTPTGTGGGYTGVAAPTPSGGGNTGASGFVPGPTDNQRPGSGYRSETGPGSSPPGTGAGRNSSAAGRLYGADAEGGRSGRGASGRGVSEGAGRGGSAAGENARGLGAGKGSGAGNLGSAATAEQAAASRAAKGASGTPMGAAGQRGKEEEDAEHQRLEFLIEPDPDSIFGNDRPATPPVIGE